jgi:4-nitrophenyl phosphatase
MIRPMSDRPRPPRLVIFDLDGVVYRGEEPVAGAAELIAALRRRDVAVRFATNNSMATRTAYVERLAGHGVVAAADEIATSTSATIDHLRAHLPDVQSVLAVGAAGLLAELRDAGYEATSAADGAPATWSGGPLPARYDAVVAGLDPDFDFRRLGIAATAIRAGARFIATNADRRYPTPDGFVPGAGSMVAAIAAASDAEPLVIGKPQPAMFAAIMERAGVPAEDTIAIGDNPDADVVAAHRAGVRAILVLTGIADAAAADALEGERRPDWVARGPAEAAALLGIDVGG